MIKLFESFDEIYKLCRKYKLEDYTINLDHTLSFHHGNVNLQTKIINLDTLPLKFKKVSGYFNITTNTLISLEGCPDIIGGSFYCGSNKLTSMVGGPKRIGGEYFCNNNNIMTFHGFPEHIGADFYCANNPISDIWRLFEDVDKVELLNEMDPLRFIDGEPHVIIDIFNDFLSIIKQPEVQNIKGYINI